MSTEIFSVLLAGVIFSFLGYVIENVWICFRFGYIDNRNMTLPFLEGYGMGAVFWYLVMGTPQMFMSTTGLSARYAYLIYVCLTAIAVSIAEICLGYATERLFGFFYWNYETIPMHITRYTSLPTSMGFGLIITFIMDQCFGDMILWAESIRSEILIPVTVTAVIILTADLIISFYRMVREKKPNKRWQFQIHRGGRRIFQH